MHHPPSTPEPPRTAVLDVVFPALTVLLAAALTLLVRALERR
ncbi:hypothetical protein [Kineococcus sp. SYSU DK004]